MEGITSSIVQPPCGHFFHQCCFDWLRRSGTCLNCRQRRHPDNEEDAKSSPDTTMDKVLAIDDRTHISSADMSLTLPMPSFANPPETSVSMIHGRRVNREPGAADSDSSVISDEEIVSNSRGSGANASMVERLT